MKAILYIFLGGGTGSLLRYLVQHSMMKYNMSTLPWATFLVNITGSLLIGMFYAISDRFHLSNEVRLLLTVGLCGGFTTFSTFSAENLMLVKEEQYAILSIYITGSIICGIGAVFAGMWVARSI